MATSNFNCAPDNTSSATFRVWCLALHTALAAIMTAVTQTGEMDFTTVALPGGINTKAGFRIYRFNDANQSTHPMFLRVDYGTGSATTHPSIWLQVGQSVNGSGVLAVPATGLIMTSTQVATSKIGTASTFDSYVSGENGRITVCLWPLFHLTSERPIIFNLERVKNASGVEIDEAIILDAPGNPNGFSFSFTKDGRNFSCLPANGATYFDIPFRKQGLWTTATMGLVVAVFPFVHWSQARVYNAVTGLLIYAMADLDGNTPVAVSIYGTTHSYFPTLRGANYIGTSDSITKLLVRND